MTSTTSLPHDEPLVTAPADATLSVGQVQDVVALAGLAPSVHNTQPWRFSWDGHALLVYDEPTRGLPVLDPAGRERILSCGAAVQNAVLAVRGLGRRCDIELVADGGAPDLLARLVPGVLEAPNEQDRLLAEAIPRRYTDRGIFTSRTVAPQAVARLQAAAEEDGTWLHPLTRTDEQIALAVLITRAAELEVSDPAYLAELSHWRTHERAEEGIPDAAVPDTPGSRRGSDYLLRDFDAATPTEPGTAERDAGGDEPPASEDPLVVVLGTGGDTREDWLRAGMALERVLLQATVDDLAASPLSQVIEVPRMRAGLRRELGVIGVPQVVLRVGYGQGRMTTWRRSAGKTLSDIS
ncbi:MAG: hypothetical protein M3Z02_01925 [Actinomycetota bacterium]|nr:hypothetical protein [Actinomycetota bacterium]